MTNTCICSAILTPLDDRERSACRRSAGTPARSGRGGHRRDSRRRHDGADAAADRENLRRSRPSGLRLLVARRDFRRRRRYEPVPHFAADPYRQRIQGRRRFSSWRRFSFSFHRKSCAITTAHLPTSRNRHCIFTIFLRGTGTSLAIETVVELAAHPNIAGIKCSGPITQTRELIDALGRGNFG